MRHRVTDWTWAYDNAANIPKSENWPGVWVEPARQARENLTGSGRARLDLPYGEGEREAFDLFLPEGEVKGLIVFVHGGFWMGLNKSFWSHLATGPLAHGHAVAIPGYPLAPEVRIAGITQAIGRAITRRRSGRWSHPPDWPFRRRTSGYKDDQQHHATCR